MSHGTLPVPHFWAELFPINKGIATWNLHRGTIGPTYSCAEFRADLSAGGNPQAAVTRSSATWEAPPLQLRGIFLSFAS